MTLLWGLMCIFVACSPDSSAPQAPNLVVVTSPATAAVSVSGGSGVTTLSEGAMSVQSGDEASTSFYATPGSHYTITVDAEGHGSFSRRVFVRDDRRTELSIGLARRGGKKAGGAYTEAFEAESAVSGSIFDIRDDDYRASAGAYLVQPASVPDVATAAEDAFISVDVPVNGSYTLWARVHGEPAESDDGFTSEEEAIYLGFNRQFSHIVPALKGEYNWVKVETTRLNAGSHRVSIGHSSAGARLDVVVVTNEELGNSQLNAFVTQVAIEEKPIVTAQPAPAPQTPSTPAQDRSTYGLRGDPSFSERQLTSEQRLWYGRLWGAIKNPDHFPNANWLANSGDIYQYRGDLQNHVIALLTAFRMTGDLRLLDEVARLAEIMRSKLADTWRGTVDGTDGTKDGFLNWITLYETNPQFKGKDTFEAYELKAHALVAMIAWALENNRDLQSPAGHRYGAQADFWKDYLVNHFEAKWRKRNKKPSGFPFIHKNQFHTFHSSIRLHHYLGKLTGNSAYSKEAERLAGVLWRNEFKDTTSKYGTAIVWARGILSEGSGENYLQPSTYARYVIQEAVDLHFEQFGEYAKSSTLEKFARTVADFMMDDSSYESFARDIGGASARAGIPVSATSWNRVSNSNYAQSPWSIIMPWDKDSGRVRQASAAVYAKLERNSDTPKTTFIAANMFLDQMMR